MNLLKKVQEQMKHSILIIPAKQIQHIEADTTVTRIPTVILILVLLIIIGCRRLHFKIK
jgi:hypothetical protein